MTLRSVFAGTAMVLLAAGCTTRPPLDDQQRTALADSVEQWAAGPFLAAYEHPNADSILAFYATGAELAVAENGTILPSYDSIVASARAFWGRPGLTAHFSLGHAQVNVLDREAAVVTGILTGSVTDSAGAQTPMRFAWTAVLQRAASGWKIVAQHTSAPPPAPAAAPARPAARGR